MLKNIARGVLPLLLVGFAFVLTAKADEPVQLGRRYVDPMHGFSIRPPIGTERKRQTVSSRLVSWQKRDDQTGAVLWTLSVLEAVESNPDIEIQPYSQALAEKLEAEENYDIDSVKISSVAGRPAAILRGTAEGIGSHFQKQAWVYAQPARPAEEALPGQPAKPARPARFVVVVVSGPADLQDRLETISQEVLETVEITDPEQALETRQARLGRGQGLLETLASRQDDRLDEAFDGRRLVPVPDGRRSDRLYATEAVQGHSRRPIRLQGGRAGDDQSVGFATDSQVSRVVHDGGPRIRVLARKASHRGRRRGRGG